MRCLRILALFPLFILTACHSPYVETTVSNHTPYSILLIEVDYPSASFGTQDLVPGADFHYRFKVLGSGNMKLTYTDKDHQDHKSDGPFLKEGTEGPLTITIEPDTIRWDPAFTSKH